MKTLSSNDVAFVASRIPRDVREWIWENGLSIGGGFIREVISGGEIRDIDVFGSSKEGLRFALRTLKARREQAGYKCRIIETANADTLLTEGRKTVQVIHRWLYESHEKVVPSFDFTVCAAVIWRAHEQGNSAWYSCTHDDFYQDLAAKRLVYTSPDRNEDAGGSLLRAFKFIKRGYNIQSNSLGKVLARLNSVIRPDSWATNDESQMGRVLTGLLREVDPGFVVDGIEPVGEKDSE